jgi:hypothetical protein
MESSMDNYLEHLKGISGWEPSLFDKKNIFETYKKISEVDLDYNNLEYIKKETDPYEELNVINDVINAKSQYKDKVILSNMERLWKKGYNLFIVFGKPHSIIHEITIEKWS